MSINFQDLAKQGYVRLFQEADMGTTKRPSTFFGEEERTGVFGRRMESMNMFEKLGARLAATFGNNYIVTVDKKDYFVPGVSYDAFKARNTELFQKLNITGAQLTNSIANVLSVSGKISAGVKAGIEKETRISGYQKEKVNTLTAEDARFLLNKCQASEKTLAAVGQFFTDPRDPKSTLKQGAEKQFAQAIDRGISDKNVPKELKTFVGFIREAAKQTNPSAKTTTAVVTSVVTPAVLPTTTPTPAPTPPTGTKIPPARPTVPAPAEAWDNPPLTEPRTTSAVSPGVTTTPTERPTTPLTTPKLTVTTTEEIRSNQQVDDAASKLAVALRPTIPEKPSVRRELSDAIKFFILQNGKLQEQTFKMPDFTSVRVNITPQPKAIGWNNEELAQKMNQLATKASSAALSTEVHTIAESLTKDWSMTKPAFDKLSMKDKFLAICFASQMGVKEAGLNTRIQHALSQLVSHFTTATLLDEQQDERQQLLAHVNALGNIQIRHDDGTVESVKNDFIDRVEGHLASLNKLLIEPGTTTRNTNQFPNLALTLTNFANEFRIDSKKFMGTTEEQLQIINPYTSYDALQQDANKQIENAVNNAREYKRVSEKPFENLNDLSYSLTTDQLALAFHREPNLRTRIFQQIFGKQTPNMNELVTQINDANLDKEEKTDMIGCLATIAGTPTITGPAPRLAIELPAAEEVTAPPTAAPAEAPVTTAAVISPREFLMSVSFTHSNLPIDEINENLTQKKENAQHLLKKMREQGLDEDAFAELSAAECKSLLNKMGMKAMKLAASFNDQLKNIFDLKKKTIASIEANPEAKLVLNLYRESKKG